MGTICFLSRSCWAGGIPLRFSLIRNALSFSIFSPKSVYSVSSLVLKSLMIIYGFLVTSSVPSPCGEGFAQVVLLSSCCIRSQVYHLSKNLYVLLPHHQR